MRGEASGDVDKAVLNGGVDEEVEDGAVDGCGGEEEDEGASAIGAAEVGENDAPAVVEFEEAAPSVVVRGVEMDGGDMALTQAGSAFDGEDAGGFLEANLD